MQPDDDIPAQNTAKNPLFIDIIGYHPFFRFLLRRRRRSHILETDQDVCEIPPTASPEEGEEYFQLGLSALTQENSPFSVTRGVFISREFSFGTNHYLGSAGSNPGDSGGGCFSETQNLLFGINVGADNLPISGNTSLNEVASRYHSRAHIVPSVFFD